jgi:hypothetical protein
MLRGPSSRAQPAVCRNACFKLSSATHRRSWSVAAGQFAAGPVLSWTWHGGGSSREALCNQTVASGPEIGSIRSAAKNYYTTACSASHLEENNLQTAQPAKVASFADGNEADVPKMAARVRLWGARGASAAGPCLHQPRATLFARGLRSNVRKMAAGCRRPFSNRTIEQRRRFCPDARSQEIRRVRLFCSQ